MADLLFLVPAVFPRLVPAFLLWQLDALLLRLHPALLVGDLLAVRHSLAVLPLNLLAHVMLLGPALLPRDVRALGLGHL